MLWNIEKIFVRMLFRLSDIGKKNRGSGEELSNSQIHEASPSR